MFVFNMATNEKNDQLFFTVSIYKWIHVLKNDTCKDIIIDSLNFLVNKGRVKVYAFVIMPNHIHLIWQIQEGFILKDVQRDFLKYTGQQIKYWLKNNHPQFLEQFKVDFKDRKYQFWKRNALSIPLWSIEVLEQKLDYIHNNPIQEKWKLSELAEEYKYSSANFYFNNVKNYSFLTQYKD